jgi:SAM-dependent methyltransferase
MDCCTHVQGLNSLFDERAAHDEAQRYWKKGLDKHSRALVAAVQSHGVDGASLLEVGGGIGGLHAELLKRGAARATDVDISAAYIAAAQSVADRLGLRERVDYRLADFVRIADDLPAADIVIMHRVVCCYPDMPGLVTAAARHAVRCLVLSFPHSAWYIRLGMRIVNTGMWARRCGVRFYVHSPSAIPAVAAAAGMTLVQDTLSWPWRIALFDRAVESTEFTARDN